MAYTFDQIFAADPATPGNVAANASVLIFAPGDATKTPLTITKPDGSPLANPVPVNANGFGSAFMHATLDRVAWEGCGFTDFFTSYEGMKEEAVSARSAAEDAAASAGAAAEADLAARIAAGEFQGPAGLDGSNVLPTETAVRQAGDPIYGTILIHNGTAYPARPAAAPAGHVKYIGPSQPTDWLTNDEWVNNA